jgi:hypothetical protein
MFEGGEEIGLFPHPRLLQEEVLLRVKVNSQDILTSGWRRSRTFLTVTPFGGARGIHLPTQNYNVALADIIAGERFQHPVPHQSCLFGCDSALQAPQP